MSDKDRVIEDIFDEVANPKNKKPKKKINAKDKGNRTELNLCKYLEEHFKVPFSRSQGSGNRWGQITHLPEHAKKTLIGDLCIPEGFRWVIESKGGYEGDIDLNNFFEGIAKLDEFMKQSTDDVNRCGRKPIICWKRNRKPWIAAVHTEDISDYLTKFEYRMLYKEWSLVLMDRLLEVTKDVKGFWFDV